MAGYIAPQQDLEFLLTKQFPTNLDTDTLHAILQEAAKFAEEILAPLNWQGDRQGAKMENNKVKTPQGFVEAYQDFARGGWNSLAAPEEVGGQNLPPSLALMLQEFWQGANISWALCPLLNQGAVELLQHLGTEQQKKRYLPKLAAGTWCGTMNLTEPQAGSDVGAVRTLAKREGEHYRLFGQKIYISYGDHDMAENIIHLVLARTPDAPPGTKGLSLFLVPKFCVLEDESLGAQNDVQAISLEHKLGQHGSPTCTMQYGEKNGAYAEIIGAENDGIRCMFIMMNNARLGVGIQGLALAERATQKAISFAISRQQGKALNNPKGESVAITHHADVRRMLLRMQSQVFAARALAAQAGSALDAKDTLRADLLTPLVKAWLTDLANEITSLNIQVHGGMGFIEETGVAQTYRDARVLAIYEGTNGIQAQDLVFRKCARDDGAAAKAYLQELKKIIAGIKEISEQQACAYLAAIEQLEITLAHILKIVHTKPDAAAAVAVPFLEGFAMIAGGVLLQQQDALCQKAEQGEVPEKLKKAKAHCSAFYLAHLLPEALAQLTICLNESNVITDCHPDFFTE